MNRKSFVLSWGRKVFFGTGWPFLTIIAINYLQSQIFPSTALGALYFITSFVGFYGLLTALLYFILYIPVVLIFPTYYVSRLWSVFLLLTTGAVLILDSMVFNQYRFHLNRFIVELLLTGRAKDVFSFQLSFFWVIFLLLVVAGGIIWLRGNWIWRGMQRRFSNPNKSWYLGIIFVCTLVALGLHYYGESRGHGTINRLTQLHPVTLPSGLGLDQKSLVLHASEKSPQGPMPKDFFYPKRKLDCRGKSQMNLLIIVAKDMRSLGEQLSHYGQHGTIFQNHHSGGTTSRAGLFSLMYSLPPIYDVIALNNEAEPALVQELKKRQYSFFRADAAIDPAAAEKWKEWLSQHLQTSEVPFFGLISVTNEEQKIASIVESLSENKVHDDTVVVLTSDTGTQVPLLIIWPGKKPAVISNFTSHYDVVPTLMTQLFGCVNEPREFSYGTSLFKKEEPTWFVTGTESDLVLLDFKKNHRITFGQRGGFRVVGPFESSVDKDDVRYELILSVLRDLTYFRKR